ncbi:MAG: class I SAM-dependent DNA methyltransferase [Thermoplasmatota archaeon]
MRSASELAIERAFDALAPAYDKEVGGTTGAARAKAVASRELARLFHAGDLVLDVGCGTGVDAVHLATRGLCVVALDLSHEMVDATRARAKSRGVDTAVRAVHLPARRAGDLAEVYGEGAFRGAYSLFGTLNLERDLDATRDGLARILAPGAPLVVGLVNPHVLWELVVYPWMMRFDKSAKKAARVTTMRVSRARDDRVPVQLFTPDEFVRRFAPAFTLERLVATNVVVPPPYLDRYVRSFPRFLSLASRVEDRVAARAPWNRLGFFSLLTLRRSAT